MNVRTAPARLWRIGDVAEFLDVSVATLYFWRSVGMGPTAYRVGKHLRFDPAEVVRWLDEQTSPPSGWKAS
jgi:DNA-binding transcriptional MerR regulator